MKIRRKVGIGLKDYLDPQLWRYIWDGTMEVEEYKIMKPSFYIAPVTQGTECLPSKQMVEGSNPSGCT